jgi:UDP-N-acetylmuramoyl-tripeptide--D-alanyl-D-alanine ligase
MRLKAKEAAGITGGRIVRGDPGAAARGVSTDTRTIKPGQAFVALKGENFDGARFIGRAVKKGAPWVIAEKRVKPGSDPDLNLIEVDDALEALGRLAADWRLRHRVKVAAVTGSLGKSTTKEMVAALLSGRGRVLKNRGNLNNRIGLPLTLFRLNRSYDYAVLEMGCNEPGEIGRLTRIARPDAGVITRVAPVHLEGLGSIKGVARAKAELVRELSTKSAFILNLDDPNIVRSARGFRGEVIGFSVRGDMKFPGESLHLVALEKEVRAGRPRINFRIQRRLKNKNKGRPVEFYLWTLARHDAVNALAACAVARAFGVSLQAAARKLKGFKGLSGRGEVVRSRKGAFIIDDTYNASPAAVADALETVAWWKGPLRGVAVLGDMLELGDEAGHYHREIGAEVARSGMAALVAKGEHARAMVRAAVEAGLPGSSAFAVKSNGEAARCLRKMVKKGDWVLVKGSRAMGMESVAEALKR